MNYTADCPQCSHEFDILGVFDAHTGLTCPKCRHEFTPEKVHRVTSAEETEWNQKVMAQAAVDTHRIQQTRIAKISETATYLNILAASFVIIAAVLLAAAGLSKLNTDKWGDGPEWAIGLFGIALIAFFFAQLFHIRAALERLNLK